jgi:hypothetical protein
MNHTQLLTLAAQSVGYQYHSRYIDRESFVVYTERVYSEVQQQYVMAEKTRDWNPLDSDSDAFRLALMLNLHPRPGTYRVSVLRPDGGWNDAMHADHDGCQAAAARYAIVCAAAEIAMQTFDMADSEPDSEPDIEAEMLDTLKAFVSVYGVDDVPRWMRVRDQARAVIARAEAKRTDCE